MISRLSHAISERWYILILVWLIALFISITFTHLPLALLRQAIASPLIRDIAGGLSAPDWPERVVVALAMLVRDAVAVAVLVAVSGGLGMWLTRRWLSLDSVSLSALQALLGLGSLSIMILVFGLLGLIPSPPVAVAITLLSLVALFRPIRTWWAPLRLGLKQLFQPYDSRFDRFVRTAACVLIGLALVIAVAPVTRWDALTYHLEAPRYFISVGRVASFPENHFFGFPELVEMLYLWLMLIARSNAAALLHACFGVLGMLAVVGLCNRLGSASPIWLVAAVLLVGESLWQEWTIPYNDLALIAYVTAALYAALAWADSDQAQPAWLVASGVCIGLAMSTKYTAVAAAVGLGCLVLWLARHRGLRQIVVAGGMVSIPALLVFSPWLVKNAALYGNPVSPFLFNSAYFDQYDQLYYLRSGTGLDLASTILAPIQGAVFGTEGLAPYGSSMGSLLVPLLPLALVGWSSRPHAERSTMAALAVFSISAYLIWLFGVASSWYLVQTRLLFPIFPALAIVVAAGVGGLARSKLPVNLSLIAQLITTVALSFAMITSAAYVISANTLPVLFGLQAESTYLENSLGTYYAAMQQVNQLPAGSKVRFLWEPRAYYCEVDCLPDSLINQWWHDRQVEPDPHKIAARWRAEGVTHILIFEEGRKLLFREEPYELLSNSDLLALNELRRSELTPVWQQYPSYSLYEWKSP